MMYKQIECPTCGNETTAKNISEAQKCRWCRRLFKVTVIRRNKEGRKGKFDWQTELVDFTDKRPGVRSINDYMDDDIYGTSKR